MRDMDESLESRGAVQEQEHIVAPQDVGQQIGEDIDNLLVLLARMVLGLLEQGAQQVYGVGQDARVNQGLGLLFVLTY